MSEHIILSAFFESGQIYKKRFATFKEYESFKENGKYYIEEVVSMIHEGNGLYREWDGEWTDESI